MLGDHIRALKDGRWLHGIDLGDQRVLYLVETPGLAPGDRLRRVYRPEFTAGSRKVELVVHRGPIYTAKAVVARAWSRFMDPSVIAMFRDSEAFAAWCKVGRLPVTPASEAAPPPAKTPVAAERPPRSPPARAAPEKAPARKPVVRRPASRKSPAGKAAAKVAAPRKAAPRAAARKAPAKQVAPKARQAPARKTPAKQVAPKARKTPARKPAGKKKGRR